MNITDLEEVAPEIDWRLYLTVILSNKLPEDLQVTIYSKTESLNIRLYHKIICIPESFNMKISHYFFYYKIIFVNLQHKNTNS